MSICEIKPAPVTDIPSMLRRLAEDLESGAVGPYRNVMLVAERRDEQGTSTTTFGWGPDAFGFYAAGMLHAGLSNLLRDPRP